MQRAVNYIDNTATMMGNKTVYKAIDKVLSKLSWPVYHAHHNRWMEIVSDNTTQIHTIYMDNGSDKPLRAIEYLHELGHAYLAERNSIFCVHRFRSDDCDINSIMPMLSNPVKSTSDWFVVDLLYQWCPDEEKAEIAEHVEYIRQIAASIKKYSPDAYIAAFLVAQGVYYLKHRRNITALANINELVAYFLSVPPAKPTTGNFSILFNALLAPLGYVARWVPGDAVWDVRRR